MQLRRGRHLYQAASRQAAQDIIQCIDTAISKAHRVDAA